MKTRAARVHTSKPQASMLAFLSRDPSNAKRIKDIQLEANASSAVKKAKKSVPKEKRSVPQPSLVFPSVPRTANVLDVDGILSSFLETANFSASIPLIRISDDDVDEKIVIPPGVKHTMETLLLNVERKFGLKKSKSSLKFLGRIKKPQLTWKQRADVIYFLLHPAFGNGDFELASTVFDIPHQTIRTWVA